MQGIYYVLSIVAVFIVFVWYIQNDSLAEGEPTRGLLAMKEPTADPTDEDPKKGRGASSGSRKSGRRRPFAPWPHRSPTKQQ